MQVSLFNTIDDKLKNSIDLISQTEKLYSFIHHIAYSLNILHLSEKCLATQNGLINVFV